MQETQVQFLGQEDSLEKEMVTHPSCLGNPMDREAWQAIVHGVARQLDKNEQLNTNWLECILSTLPCPWKSGRGLEAAG